MSFPKLGRFRKVSQDLAKNRSLSRLQFEMILWLSEQEWADVYEMARELGVSNTSIHNNIIQLLDENWIKIVRREYRTESMARKYAITGRSRKMITDFYMRMQHSTWDV